MPVFNLERDMPIVGTTFFLEIQGEKLTNLTSVDGLSTEVETTDLNQRTDKGQLVQQVMMAKPKFTGALTLKRYAPLDVKGDAIWKWFEEIRTKGMSALNRMDMRKHGSIVLFDTTLTEVARWNFTNCWPSKIETDGMDVTKNDPVSETITLQYEMLTRVK